MPQPPNTIAHSQPNCRKVRAGGFHCIACVIISQILPATQPRTIRQFFS
jgi:hypothetical protein